MNCLLVKKREFSDYDKLLVIGVIKNLVPTLFTSYKLKRNDMCKYFCLILNLMIKKLVGVNYNIGFWNQAEF